MCLINCCRKSGEVSIKIFSFEVFKCAKENHGKSAEPKWNFHKILINKEGKVEDTFASFTKPMSKIMIKAIENSL